MKGKLFAVVFLFMTNSWLLAQAKFKVIYELNVSQKEYYNQAYARENFQLMRDIMVLLKSGELASYANKEAQKEKRTMTWADYKKLFSRLFDPESMPDFYDAGAIKDDILAEILARNCNLGLAYEVVLSPNASAKSRKLTEVYLMPRKEVSHNLPRIIATIPYKDLAKRLKKNKLATWINPDNNGFELPVCEALEARYFAAVCVDIYKPDATEAVSFSREDLGFGPNLNGFQVDFEAVQKGLLLGQVPEGKKEVVFKLNYEVVPDYQSDTYKVIYEKEGSHLAQMLTQAALDGKLNFYSWIIEDKVLQASMGGNYSSYLKGSQAQKINVLSKEEIERNLARPFGGEKKVELSKLVFECFYEVSYLNGSRTAYRLTKIQVFIPAEVSPMGLNHPIGVVKIEELKALLASNSTAFAALAPVVNELNKPFERALFFVAKSIFSQDLYFNDYSAAKANMVDRLPRELQEILRKDDKVIKKKK